MNTKLKPIWSLLLLTVVFVTACSDEDPVITPFGIAFETTALGLDASMSSVNALLTFTTATLVDNTITISVEETGVTHNAEYTTIPAAIDGKVLIDIPAGSTGAQFSINKAVDFIALGSSVKFTIESVSGEEDPIIQGNVTLDLSFEAISSPNGTFAAEVGGPGQPDMVFIDLSLAKQSTAERIGWDLGFYNGSEDKVILNYSTFMLAKILEKSDINSVSATDTVGFSALVATAATGSADLVDDPNGDLSKTVIQVSTTDSENKVYILNLGGAPGEEDPAVGSANVATTIRGWKKVRILKSGSDYKIQYADIADTDFQEATITKDAAYNFTYFSVVNGTEATVEPTKTAWDFVFTPCTNNEAFGFVLAYGFSDFVLTNRHGGATIYMIDSDEDDAGTIDAGKKVYTDFTSSDVVDGDFSSDANIIGDSWRSVFSHMTYADRYYIIKDADDNIYKLQFTSIVNESGERGFPSLKYELL